jgi:hypothetical protein
MSVLGKFCIVFPSRIHCLWGNLFAAGLISFAILVPFDGFLLAVGYLVSNCNLRCIVAFAGIAAYLVIHPVT